MKRFTALNAEPAGDDIRLEQLRGREWLVAPVVLVREGVLNGGFLSYDEIQKSVPGWNGRIVTAPPAADTEAADLAPNEPSGHPIDGQTDDGRPRYTTANALPFVEDMGTGLVLNVEASEDLPTPGDEQSERGLVGEVWVDLEQAEQVGDKAVDAVETMADGGRLDVSTGYFHRPERTSGTYNGESYEVEQYDLLPDHLALLPNERGACSWGDGCGAPYPSADAADGGAAQAAASSGFESSGHSTPRAGASTADPAFAINEGDEAGDTDDGTLAAHARSFAERVRALVGSGDGESGPAGDESGDCSPGPCSCGEHTGNEGEDDTDDPENDDTTTQTMKYDTNELADRSAFDVETLDEWDEDDLAALAESLDADDGTDGTDDDDPTANANADDGTDALLERVNELEQVVEAQAHEKRERLAAQAAPLTDYEADDLAANTDEFPTKALETLAEAANAGGTAQGGTAPQGNRANYLAQGGSRQNPVDDTPSDDEVQEATANVGALAAMGDD